MITDMIYMDQSKEALNTIIWTLAHGKVKFMLKFPS